MNAHTKTDQPPFRMRIENGHLVPATPYDAERLSTFRSSRELLVYPTQQPNRKLVQKWFAVISKAVSECPTPWHNKDQASDAIKLALGHGTPIKTVGGNWVQVPKSLNELNDAELSDLFDRAMTLLERITGVDPLTLGAEATSVDAPDDHEDQNTDAPPRASDQEAADMSSADASTEGGEVSPPASPPSPLVQYAGYLVRMVQNFVDDGSITETDECKKALNDAWKNATDPDGIAYLVDASEETMKKAKSFTGWAMDVIDQKNSMLKFRSKVCEVANCRPKDLEQPA